MEDKNKFSLLKKFQPLCFAPNLPALYGAGLTDYEILVRLLKAVNDVIERVNSWSEMFEEIKEYLDKLDDEVKKQVTEYLQNLYNSGELKSIVNEIVIPYLDEVIEKMRKEPPKTENLTFSRYGRIYRKMQDDIINKGASATINSEYYSFAQGSTVFTVGGIKYLVVCYVCSNNSNFRYNDNALLVVYNYNTLTALRSITISTGHSNAVAYNPDDGYLYIAHDFHYNHGTTQVPVCQVSRIRFSDLNAETFQTKSVTNADGNAISGLSKISQICYYNHQLYVGWRYRILKFDWNSGTAVDWVNPYLSPSDPLQKERGFLANSIVTDGYIYHLHHLPSMISRYNLTTKKFDWIYQLPPIQDDYYRLCEPEGIAIDDNLNCTIITCGHPQIKAVCGYDMTQIFTQNLMTHTHPFSNSRAYNENILEIFVDNTPENTAINPDGSTDNPFKFLSEAVMYASDYPYSDSIRIFLRSDIHEYIYILSTGKSFNIRSAPDNQLIKKHIASSTGKPFIGGVHINGCNVSLDSICLTCSLPSDALGDYNKSLLEAVNASVTDVLDVSVVDRAAGDSYCKTLYLNRGSVFSLSYNEGKGRTESAWREKGSGFNYLDNRHGLAVAHNHVRYNGDVEASFGNGVIGFTENPH